MNLKSRNLTVDDLGLIKGDTHDIKCHKGQGFSGQVGSGKRFYFDISQLPINVIIRFCLLSNFKCHP